MKTLTISRKKWLRGEDGPNSLLLREDGKMCCLGFHALSCGLNREQIFNVMNPAGVEEGAIDKLPEWIVANGDDTDTTLQLMEANDSKYITEEEREGTIRELFRDNGVRVRFVP